MVSEVEELTQSEYELFRKLVYTQSGISLGDQKLQLVRARFSKIMRQRGFRSFRQYYDCVQSDTTGAELCQLLDAIATNTTHLFREPRHFELLGGIIRAWAQDKTARLGDQVLRLWSAGCSSGEEPYSMAMVAHDQLRASPGRELRILGTDISIQMLNRAKAGVFDAHRVGTVPPEFRRRYLVNVVRDGHSAVQVAPELRQAITFARFNLMAPAFPFRHGFHVIFCRNVMIYFDRPTQQRLVAAFAQQLRVGGYLMIGHSESLNAITHSLRYVEPTVYRKE